MKMPGGADITGYIRILLVFLCFCGTVSCATEAYKDTDDSVSEPGRTFEPPEGATPEKNSDGQTKKCLTVCDKWDKECILNSRYGTRKCRRVCKVFIQECS